MLALVALVCHTCNVRLSFLHSDGLLILLNNICAQSDIFTEVSCRSFVSIVTSYVMVSILIVMSMVYQMAGNCGRDFD